MKMLRRAVVAAAASLRLTAGDHAGYATFYRDRVSIIQNTSPLQAMYPWAITFLDYHATLYSVIKPYFPKTTQNVFNDFELVPRVFVYGHLIFDLSQDNRDIIEKYIWLKESLKKDLKKPMIEDLKKQMQEDWEITMRKWAIMEFAPKVHAYINGKNGFNDVNKTINRWEDEITADKYQGYGNPTSADLAVFGVLWQLSPAKIDDRPVNQWFKRFAPLVKNFRR